MLRCSDGSDRPGQGDVACVGDGVLSVVMFVLLQVPLVVAMVISVAVGLIEWSG